MLNICTFGGRLVKDPEERKTASGLSITHITIAVERAIKRNDDRDKPLYLDCTFFGNQAVNVAKTFRKGKVIYVSGRLENEQVESRKHPGEKVTVYTLIASNYDYEIGAPKQGDAQQPPVGGGAAPSSANQSASVGAAPSQPKREPQGLNEGDAIIEDTLPW